MTNKTIARASTLFSLFLLSDNKIVPNMRPGMSMFKHLFTLNCFSTSAINLARVAKNDEADMLRYPNDDD